MSYDAGAVVGRIVLNTRSWDTGHGKVLTDLRTLGRVAVTYGAVATAAIYKLTKQYGEFEREMRRATSVLNDMMEETFASMSKTAEDTAIKWNMAATETAKAYLYMGRAGLTAAEQMQAFPHMIVASKAMLEDLQETTEGVINTMNAFHYSFSQTGKVVDIVTEAVNRSTQDLGDMLIALSYSAKPAQAMNNSLSDLSAMLALVANEGIRGSKSGTAIRFALTALASPMTDTRRMIRDLGLQIYDSTGRTKPFVDILAQLQTRLQGATEETRNIVLETLFGRRALPAMIALFQVGADNIKAFSQEIEGAGQAAENVAQRQMKSFLDQLGRMWQTLQSLTRHIAQALVPTFTTWANTLQEKFAVWREWVDVNQEAIKHIGELVVKISALAVVLGTAALILPSFVSAFRAVADIAKGLFAVVSNPFNSITVLIAGLYVLSVMWRSNFNGMQTVTKNFYHATTTYLTELAKDFKVTFNYLRDEWDVMLVDMLGVFGKAIVLIMRGMAFIGKIPAAAVDKWARAITAAVSGDWNEAWKQATMGMGGAVDQITKDWDSMLSIAADTMPKIGQAIVNATDYVYESLQDIGGLTLTYLKRDLGTALSYINGVVNTAFDQIFGKLLTPLEKKFNFSPITLQKPMYEGWGDRAPSRANNTLPIVEEWRKGVQLVINNMKTMQEGVDSALNNIVTGWADAFDYMMQKGSSFSTFMDKLFQSILSSFTRMIAEMAANQMFWAMFGKGVNRNGEGVGSPLTLGTLWGDLTNRNTPTTVGGLLLPEYTPQYQSSLPNVGTPKVAFNIVNQSGVQVEAEQEGPARFNGEEYIVNVVMKRLGTNPSFKRSFQPEY